MSKFPHIPGYSISRVLAQGNMATVYLAQQQGSQEELALKLVAIKDLLDGATVERLVKHAQLAKRLTHPHIVPINEVGKTQDYCYIAMPALKANLSQLIPRGIKVGQLLKIARSMANALSFAHEKSYIHGHINSQNILFRADGSPVLSGFSCSTLFVQSVDLKQLSLLHSYYMSPERFRGDSADFASDFYALGIVLFEMLEGHLPFSGDSVQAVAKQHLSQPIPRLSKNKVVFQRLIDGLLAKNKQQRIQTAAQVIEQLDAIYAVLRKQSSQPSPEPAKAEPVSAPSKSDDANVLRAFKDDRPVQQESPAVSASGRSKLAVLLLLLVLLAGAIAGVVFAPQLAPNTPLMTWHNAIKSLWQVKPKVDPIKEKIAQQLSLAKQAMQQEHYVLPLSDSALEHYRAALKLDNFNAEAQQGLDNLAQLLLSKADSAAVDGAFDKAADYLSQVRTIDKHYPGLMQADLKLRQLQEQAQEQQAQAQQEKQRLAEQQAQLARQKAAEEKARQQRLAKEQAEKAEQLRKQAEQEARDAAAAKLFTNVRIRGLLAKAQTHVSRGEYYSPNGDNALSNYAEVLKLDAANQEAQQGIKASIEKTIAAMSELNSQGQQAQAQLIYQYALSLSQGYQQPLLDFANRAGW